MDDKNKEFCKCCGAPKKRCYENGEDKESIWWRCLECHEDFVYKKK